MGRAGNDKRKRADSDEEVHPDDGDAAGAGLGKPDFPSKDKRDKKANKHDKSNGKGRDHNKPNHKGKGKGKDKSGDDDAGRFLAIEGSIGQDMDGDAGDGFAFHTTLDARVTPITEGSIAAFEDGNRTDRVALSAISVAAGDLSAIEAWQSIWQQKARVNSIKGIDGYIIYSPDALNMVAEAADKVMISNIGQAWLQGIGHGKILGERFSTFGLPLIVDDYATKPRDINDDDELDDAIDTVALSQPCLSFPDDETNHLGVGAMTIDPGCFWLLFMKHRGSTWVKVENEMLHTWHGDTSPAFSQLFGCFERIYELNFTSFQLNAFEKYIPRLTRREAWDEVRKLEVRALGVWGYTPYINMINYLNGADLQNHGVRYTRM